MKIFLKFNVFILLLGLLFVGCQDETMTGTGTDSDSGSTGTTTSGYLSLGAMSVNLIVESELMGDVASAATVSKSDVSGDVSSDVSTSEQEAADDFIIKITNTASSEVMLSSSYAELKNTDNLEIAPGTYMIEAYPASAEVTVGWTSPYYYGYKEFTIVKEQTTKIDEIVCTLANIKVSVTLSADLKALFLHDDISTEKNVFTTISLGDNSLVFERDETRNGYFKAVETTNKLDVVLHGWFNTAAGDEDASYSEIDWVSSISNVKAGQWREITIQIENADSGNAEFKMTVEGWAYDEEIPVDIMSSFYTFTEEVIPEPGNEVTDVDSPVITMDDGTQVSDLYQINSSMFDADLGSWYSRISATATPVGSASIKSIKVRFDSDNANLMENLELSGYSDHTISIWTENDESDYIFTKQDGQTVQVKLTDAGMTRLYNYAGTHTTTIICEDDLGRTSYTSFVIEVTQTISGDGPSVVWTSGASFDQTHTISASTAEDFEVAIQITSSTGITGFLVNINSEVLTAGTLEAMCLAESMDLINPSDANGDYYADMDDMLGTLGFPTGDAVKGKTSLPLDISEFMTPLTVLGVGKSEFELVVTDASGTTTRTISINVVED